MTKVTYYVIVGLNPHGKDLNINIWFHEEVKHPKVSCSNTHLHVTHRSAEEAEFTGIQADTISATYQNIQADPPAPFISLLLQ